MAPPGVAATEGSRTEVVPYDQCVDLDTGSYSCATGRGVLRVTTTPSSAPVRNSTTVSTSFRTERLRYQRQLPGAFERRGRTGRVGARPAAHDKPGSGESRCADRALDARCLIQTATLWVPETLRTSCGLLIFVYQAAEAVASYNPVKLRRGGLGKGS